MLERAPARLAQVRNRASQTLVWATANNLSLLTVALDHLTLGRTWLLEVQHLRADTAAWTRARAKLDQAVRGLREAGQEQELPHGLIARAAWHRARLAHADAPGQEASLEDAARDLEDAARDLDEAEEIAERGSMRLHLADIALERARLALAQARPDDAREHLDRAKELINATGYHRRDRDLADLEPRIAAAQAAEARANAAAAANTERQADLDTKPAGTSQPIESDPGPDSTPEPSMTSSTSMSPPISTLQIQQLAGKVDIGIITIRHDEYTAVLDRLPGYQTVVGGKELYTYAEVPMAGGRSARVAAVRCLHQGEGSAQAVARSFIDDLAPRWLFLVGIAGGIPDSEYSLGDVHLCRALHDFSVSAALEGKPREFIGAGGPMHRKVERVLAHLPALSQHLQDWNSPESIGRVKPHIEVPETSDNDSFYGDKSWRRKVHESLRANFPSAQPPRNPSFRDGATISSDTLVKDTALLQQWKASARDATHVEMELSGVYLAARRTQDGQGKDRECPVLAIRGLSDVVGYKRSPAWTEYACHTAAAFALALIKGGVLSLVEDDFGASDDVVNAAVAPAIAPEPSPALKMWREKLAFLQEREARESDAAMLFKIRKRSRTPGPGSANSKRTANSEGGLGACGLFNEARLFTFEMCAGRASPWCQPGAAWMQK